MLSMLLFKWWTDSFAFVENYKYRLVMMVGVLWNLVELFNDSILTRVTFSQLKKWNDDTRGVFGVI